MQERTVLSFYLRVWRTVALYASFALTAGVGCLFYLLTAQGMADRLVGNDVDLNVFFYPFLVQTLIAPLFLNSLLREFGRRDTVMREQLFSPEKADMSNRCIAAAVLRSRYFQVELGILLLLPILLPLEAGFYPLVYLLFHGSTLSRGVQKLILMAILLPLFFGLSLWQHISAFYDWRDAAAAKLPYPDRRTLWPAIGICAFYLLCLLALPSIISILLAALLIVATAGALYIAILSVALVLLFFALRYLRAWRIRRRFVKNLRERCEKCGFLLSDIKRPYRSLFRTGEGVQFTVKAHGKIYSCKMLAGISRGKPITLSEDGTAGIIHIVGFRSLPLGQRMNAAAAFFAPEGRAGKIAPFGGQCHFIEFFRFTTKTDFAFEGEGQKVLIVNPVPIYLQAGSEKTARPIDNGETVGDYKIFAGSAFLNALERDCIDRTN